MQTSQTRAYPNRLNWRCENLLTRNLDSVRGKRILDLGSHDGRFSYACLRLGAKHVTGIEGRPQLVQHANENLLGLDCRAEDFRFIEGDMFDCLPRLNAGEFDTVLCLGIFYHTIRQVELLRELRRLRPRNLVLDTNVSRERFSFKLDSLLGRIRGKRSLPPEEARLSKAFQGAYLQFRRENHRGEGSTGSTIDPVGMAAIPTKPLVELLLESHGFRFREIRWKEAGISDWTHLHDYRKGKRVSYIAQMDPGDCEIRF